MSYKVIHFFTDLQDDNQPYNVGDIFPRDGLKVSVSRLAELSSSDNKQHKPLIQEIVEEAKEEIQTEAIPDEVKHTKNEVSRMTTAELKSLAKELDLDDSLTGAALKPLIIKKLGL